jgi:hypothetical protein
MAGLVVKIIGIYRIKIENENLNLFNPNDWELMNAFFIKTLPRFEMAFEGFLKRLK